MSIADDVYKAVIKKVPNAVRKYGAEALGSAILRASRKDTTDIEKLADAVIKSLKPKTNEEKNKPTLTDAEEKQILSKLLKVFNSVSSPEQLKSAKKYHSLALKKLSAKSLDEFHGERGEIGDLALKISSAISNKEKKYTPVDEGQIYSTGGGAGQSYRKFTPKVDKTLDEDWGSSDWTAALKDFKRDLEHVKNADDIADSAYSIASSFNEPRKYSDDPWTNFTPKRLLDMALRREIVPKELISTVEGILSGKIQVRIAHELDEEVLIKRLSQESSIMKGLVAESKCPKCGGPLVSEEMLHEKKDACYYKVKSRYKVWPSAYASGALVKCRKKGAKNWGKKSESISEAYDQQAADRALFTAMKELAKAIKPRIENIIARKAESKPWSNFARKVNSDVSSVLYIPYLRQAFHTPDTKNELTDEKVEKLLTTKYPRGKFGSELYISNDANTGWLHFSRNDSSKFKKQSKQSKKMYQTLDTSIDIDQLDKIITDLAKYLSSDESDATGFYEFKVPTDGYDKEADSLVAYFAPGYDLTSMGASVIQTIVNNAQRPKHRATYGTDVKDVKFSKHYDQLSGHESDSGMLLIKFGDYLVDKAEQLNDYFKKYDDNKMAEILVKTWKDKFETKDWQTFRENKGSSMPGTYEQEYNMFKSKGPERIIAMTNEADKDVAEGSNNLNYIGNCTDDDVIEHIFGDATNFAQAVEKHGDEFTINDLVVKYDPKTDIHSFYYKQQGVAEEQLDELKCWPGYHRVKGTKAGFPGSCAKNTSEDLSEVDSLAEDLYKWFKEKWVRFGPDGKIRGDCARGSDSEGKPKCLPQKKAHALGKKGRASAAARKRRQDPNPERKGKAKNVPTKKKK